MQSNKLILLSSLAALVLCAAPYGCSGKYESTGPSATHGEGSSTNVTVSDGKSSGPTYGDGQNPGGSQGDGAYFPVRDGCNCSDGSFSHGDGNGPVVRDGSPFSDGFLTGGDGAQYFDGNGTFPEGTPNYADGAADGWDAQGDGAADAEGHADGSPG